MRGSAPARRRTIVLTHSTEELDRYYPRTAVRALERFGSVVTNPCQAHLNPYELLALAPDAELIISERNTGIDRSYIEAANQLVAFIRSGVEILNVDLEAATEHGVIVVNTPGLYVTPVVELVVGLMVNLARRVVEHSVALHEGRQLPRSVDFELSGKTVGIIGLGEIGRRLANIARSLGMSVVAYDPYREKAPGIELVDLQTLMSASDFVSVHAKLTPDSRHLLSSRELGWMKSTAFLINTSRGPIVDEPALFEALSNNRIAGAALDVFEDESEEGLASNPLCRLPNVIATPHIGGHSWETMVRQAEATVRLAETILLGKEPSPHHIVNRDVLTKTNLRLLRHNRTQA
jgi:D-3-phosphoglycerate dehydrogenase